MVRRLLITLAVLFPTAALTDEPLPTPSAWETCSPSGEYCARLDPADKSIVAYRKTDRGAILWRGHGWSRVAALADDGEHLVLGYQGMNLIPLNYRSDMTMLTFYRSGEIFLEVPLSHLVDDLTISMNRTASHYHWGDYLGLDADGYYVVKTPVGRRIRFDLTTGLQTR